MFRIIVLILFCVPAMAIDGNIEIRYSDGTYINHECRLEYFNQSDTMVTGNGQSINEYNVFCNNTDPKPFHDFNSLSFTSVNGVPVWCPVWYSFIGFDTFVLVLECDDGVYKNAFE